MDHAETHEWHVAINRANPIGGKERRSWMYEAKDACLETPRLAKLFKMQREGTLPQTHWQCSQQPVEPIKNELTCCLGVKCAECPALLSIRTVQADPERVDEMMAWTCVAHILTSGGDPAKEGYVCTTSDQLFWQRTYANMAQSDEEPQP